MASFQFNRDYSLYIGEPNDDEGLLVKDLHIEFEVTQVIDNKLKAGDGKVKIYNLAESSIKKLQKPQTYIRLLAGYKDSGMAEVLLGNATDIRTEKEGSDMVTTLHIGEAYTILHNVRVTSQIPAGKTVEDVIRELANKAGMPIGNIYGEGVKTQLLYGYPLSGTVKFQLDEICSAYRLKWKFDSNKLVVADEEGFISADRTIAYVLTKDSGLLGIPTYREYNYGTIKVEEHTHDDKTKKVNKPIKKQGIEFTALLNPRVKPGSLVLVQSAIGAVPTGTYMVQTVQYKGSFRGNDWQMTVLCDKVDYSKAELARGQRLA